MTADMPSIRINDPKVEELQPEHLGKLEFYLEALDRDVRKPHEKPSIGVLLCAPRTERLSSTP